MHSEIKAVIFDFGGVLIDWSPHNLYKDYFSTTEEIDAFLAEIDFYADDRFFYFMDNKTFEQPAIGAEMIGDLAGFLKEGLDVKLTFYGSEPLDVELPTSVELEVTESEVAARGDTATGLTKKVVCETGLEVQTPAFIEVGDTIKVDTRTGEYLTRV